MSCRKRRLPKLYLFPFRRYYFSGSIYESAGVSGKIAITVSYFAAMCQHTSVFTGKQVYSHGRLSYFGMILMAYSHEFDL